MRANYVMWMLIAATLFLARPDTCPAQEEPVRLQAMMIKAQHTPAPSDGRLEQVEYKLRRVFQFKYYRFISSGETTIARGEEGEIQLGEGNQLRLKSSGPGRIQVRWFKGAEALLSTGVAISRESPFVLGGVPSDDGTLIVVLTEK